MPTRPSSVSDFCPQQRRQVGRGRLADAPSGLFLGATVIPDGISDSVLVPLGAGAPAGKVTEEGSGIALSGVTVSVATSPYFAPNVASTRTAAGGVYTLGPLNPGTYYVRTDNPGYYVDELYFDVPSPRLGSFRWSVPSGAGSPVGVTGEAARVESRLVAVGPHGERLVVATAKAMGRKSGHDRDRIRLVQFQEVAIEHGGFQGGCRLGQTGPGCYHETS